MNINKIKEALEILEGEDATLEDFECYHNNLLYMAGFYCGTNEEKAIAKRDALNVILNEVKAELA